MANNPKSGGNVGKDLCPSTNPAQRESDTDQKLAQRQEGAFVIFTFAADLH